MTGNSKSLLIALFGRAALAIASLVFLSSAATRASLAEGEKVSGNTPRVAIIGTIHVLNDDQGSVQCVVIVDDTGVETHIFEDEWQKLISLDQKRVEVTGILKTRESIIFVRSDSAGNKIPISLVEQDRLHSDSPVEVGLGEIRILTKVELTARRFGERSTLMGRKAQSRRELTARRFGERSTILAGVGVLFFVILCGVAIRFRRRHP